MAYNGRRGPNVSEYIANLNAIPSAQDIQSSQDTFNLEDDLAMFTNTNFFDFDLGVQDGDILGGGDAAQAPVASEGTDMKSLDFGLQGMEIYSCYSVYPELSPSTSAIQHLHFGSTKVSSIVSLRNCLLTPRRARYTVYPYHPIDLCFDLLSLLQHVHRFVAFRCIRVQCLQQLCIYIQLPWFKPMVKILLYHPCIWRDITCSLMNTTDLTSSNEQYRYLDYLPD
jgi:hypothetical protein